MDEYEQKNQEAHKAYTEDILAGATLLYTGTVSGPYTTSTTYFLDNWKSYTIVTRSSLSWVPNPINIY